MKKHIKTWPAVILVVVLSWANIAAAQQPTDWSWLDNFIQSSMKDWKVPGVSVAVVRDHSVVYLKGFGVRDIRKPQPVTADTLFDIGSCTKAFTAAAAAILVDRGKMQWDGKVRTYVPFFHLEDPLADEYVTMRDLLTHRTGLPGADLMWYQSNVPREELIRRLAYVKPTAGFRTQFQYQNMMYATAGQAVGNAAGSTWDQFVREDIFQPLGMTDSDTSAVEAQKSADYATPHESNPDGSVKAINWVNIDNVGPAGSINSSARDMAKWISFQLGDGTYDGKRVISAQNMRLMHTPQMVIPPDGEIPKVFFPDSTQLSYGLGWFIQQYRGHELILHAGDIDGFSTMVVLIPEIHTGYFVDINLSSSYRQVLSYEIADKLLQLPAQDWSAHFRKVEADLKAEEKAGEAWQSKRVAGTHPSREPRAYAGKYENPAYGEAEVTLQNTGLVFRFHSFTSPLEHWQYDTFVANLDGKTRLAFCLDADGNVTGFTLNGIRFVRQAESKSSH
ncbi:MAG TPA: serine hydrolase [Terriglobales bacterium]|nr:serine hydrolase [Terriglobales bacterium]